MSCVQRSGSKIRAHSAENVQVSTISRSIPKFTHENVDRDFAEIGRCTHEREGSGGQHGGTNRGGRSQADHHLHVLLLRLRRHFGGAAHSGIPTQHLQTICQFLERSCQQLAARFRPPRVEVLLHVANRGVYLQLPPEPRAAVVKCIASSRGLKPTNLRKYYKLSVLVKD